MFNYVMIFIYKYVKYYFEYVHVRGTVRLPSISQVYYTLINYYICTFR